MPCKGRAAVHHHASQAVAVVGGRAGAAAAHAALQSEGAHVQVHRELKAVLDLRRSWCCWW